MSSTYSIEVFLTANRHRLEEHVHCLVTSLPIEPSLLLLHFSCPSESCQEPLARRDVINCIDDETCIVVRSHVVILVSFY